MTSYCYGMFKVLKVPKPKQDQSSFRKATNLWKAQAQNYLVKSTNRKFHNSFHRVHINRQIYSVLTNYL